MVSTAGTRVVGRPPGNHPHRSVKLPRVGIEALRRQQLIAATMAPVYEAGPYDATVSRIARHAGVSAGIISHYFGGKNGLLEATMRQILSDLGAAVARRRATLNHPS